MHQWKKPNFLSDRLYELICLCFFICGHVNGFGNGSVYWFGNRFAVGNIFAGYCIRGLQREYNILPESGLPGKQAVIASAAYCLSQVFRENRQ